MSRAVGQLIRPWSALSSIRGHQIRLFHQLDEKWIQKWSALPANPWTKRSDPNNARHYYQLPMFPYPSGRLHIGHLRVYTISDALARFRRMRGFDVIHPIGWDAFGLPAENAAIENGINAAEWTYEHISVMRDQLKRMMISFDWDREVITCHSDYYKHTQQIFLEFFKAGLAYRANALVNWDPVDKTVLANEQIDCQGRSWRSGAVAEQRQLEQWFLKITDFAEELSADLALLGEGWPEKVKKMQNQWIGLSEGAEVVFGEQLNAFTTRLETLPGVKFVSIGETHPLALSNVENTRPNGLVEGIEARNPLTGEPLPVFVAPYVVSDYGSGVVMGVPAHDERDRAYWEHVGSHERIEPVVANGQIVTGPQQFIGLDIASARKAMLETLVANGKGSAKQYTRIRDWLVSRQRFWGAPIPMVHCSDCGILPVPEDQLPVKLPDDTKNVPLSLNKEWLETTCPSCGGPAHRDADTMDTFMDSSWYFFRYLDPHNSVTPFDAGKVANNVPVDCYIGGIEHAILHLLYSRFLAKFLAKQGKWDGGDLKGEPFRRLVTQGMVHGKTFREVATGRYLKPDEVAKLKNSDEATMKAQGIAVSMEKMSKSKYNGVDPLTVIEEHGADATRAHMLFQAAIPDTLDWDADKIVGVERWLAKITNIGHQIYGGSGAASKNGTAPWNQACKLLQSITESMSESLSLNTVISDYMKFTKCVGDLAAADQDLAKKAYEVLVKIVAPVCPATADELWENVLRAQKKPWSSVHAESWPTMEPIVEQTSTCEFKVLMNSRPYKPPVFAHAESSESDLLKLIDLKGREVKRVIYKPKIKLLSIVTN